MCRRELANESTVFSPSTFWFTVYGICVLSWLNLIKTIYDLDIILGTDITVLSFDGRTCLDMLCFSKCQTCFNHSTAKN